MRHAALQAEPHRASCKHRRTTDRYPTSLPFIPPPGQPSARFEAPNAKPRSWRDLAIAIALVSVLTQATVVFLLKKNVGQAEAVVGTMGNPREREGVADKKSASPNAVEVGTPDVSGPRYTMSRGFLNKNDRDKESSQPKYQAAPGTSLNYKEQKPETTPTNRYEGPLASQNDTRDYKPAPNSSRDNNRVATGPAYGNGSPITSDRAPGPTRDYKGNPETMPGNGYKSGLDSRPAQTYIPNGNSARTVGPLYRGGPLPVAPGHTASIGFWHNKNGQALLRSFNGGPNATALADWLATSFPNLYGKGAGPSNLTGKTNNQVAAFYLILFNVRGQKLDAQVMNTAISTFATTSSLGGNWARRYGFTVSAEGAGAATFDVGMHGAAFGVSNNAPASLRQLLQATNDRAVHGVLFNGSQTLRHQANSVFGSLNEAGDID